MRTGVVGLCRRGESLQIVDLIHEDINETEQHDIRIVLFIITPFAVCIVYRTREGATSIYDCPSPSIVYTADETLYGRDIEDFESAVSAVIVNVECRMGFLLGTGTNHSENDAGSGDMGGCRDGWTIEDVDVLKLTVEGSGH